MNSINESKNICLKKRNINNNNFKIYINNALNKSLHNNFINNLLLRNKEHFQSSSSISNNIKKNITPNKYFHRINKKNGDIINSKNGSFFNDCSVEKPKIKIKLHSTTHNNININSISTEKNNNSIKYKIHRINPKNMKSCDRTSDVIYNQPNINIKRKRKNVSTIQNSIDNSYSNTNKIKNKRYSNINYYFNLIQEQNLIALNNNIEKLIKGQTIYNLKSARNNIFENKIKNFKKSDNEMNKSSCNINNNKNKNESNNLKNLIYKKKIQKKIINNCNDYSDTFSKIKFLNLEKESEKKDIRISDKKNKKNKVDANLLTNLLNDNTKTYKLIYDKYQTPDLLSKTCDEHENINNFNNKKHSSMLLSPFLSSKSNKINSKNTQTINNYIKIENNNNNNNPSLKYNEKNIIKLDEKLNQENKNEKLKVKGNDNIRNKNSDNMNKKISGLNSIKSIGDSKKLNKNNCINKNNLNTIVNNHNFVVNSNSISDFNTINTLNNSERNYNNFNHDLKNRLNLKTMKENFFVLEYINVKQNKNTEQLNQKIDQCGKKLLKNIITSIECKSKDRKNDNQKNVILSEFSKNGKLNITLKKMNNSIEKVLRDNSIPKETKIIKVTTKLPNESLTYVKKNQGTSLTKNKK